MAIEICAPIGEAEVSSVAWEADAYGAPSSVTVASADCSVEVSSGVAVGGVPYEGSYEVIPSREQQELPTEGRVMRRNVTVGAIPSNYGLITWNGSTLTVS